MLYQHTISHLLDTVKVIVKALGNITQNLDKYEPNVIVLVVDTVARLGKLPVLDQTIASSVLSAVSTVLTDNKDILHGLEDKHETSQR